MAFFKLASHITTTKWSANTQQAIVAGIATLTNTEQTKAFFTYCLEWKIAPWVFSQLKRNGLSLPTETWNDFEAAYQKVKDQNEARNKTALGFLERFQAAGIEIAVLKGNYLAHTVYEEVGYKRMNDFDILIHKKDWDKIQDIYLELGYIPLGNGWSGEKEKPASYSHVGMTYISPDFTCIVGSQWGLKSPTTPYTIDIDKVWNDVHDFNFCGQAVKALSPEYNLLHLVLHLGVYKCGIRDCMDLYNLANNMPIDYEKYAAICREAKCESKSVFALSVSNFSTSQFTIQEKQSIKGFLKTRLEKRSAIHARTNDYQASYNDYFQDVEKQVIYFSLFPKLHKRFKYYIRILGLIYFPKAAFSLKLNDNSDRPTIWRKFVSWLKAPYYIFSLIAQEIGWKFTVLLFLKLFFDLIFSLKNYFIRTDSYFDYLRKKGINPKAIEAVVKNIQ
ncbi:MAG: hypothetical protein GQ574_11075 [Crocinitomix sp.]|nr:hypothetical protein [Crocinitomix sp.]